MLYPDKHGEALNTQRFKMLEDIAAELSQGGIVFPTYFDAALKIRNLMQHEDASLHDIALAVSAEPLISAKLIKMANSTAFNPRGHEVTHLPGALARLGTRHVQTAALAIANTQLIRARGMAEYSTVAQQLWIHSINTAATAQILAQECSTLNPDVAMLAGLVHDLGAFYMLYRSVHYSELRERPDSLLHLIAEWHEAIGSTLLNSLGLPQEIVAASEEHDHPRPLPGSLNRMADLIYVANMYAGGYQESSIQDSPAYATAQAEIKAAYAHLAERIEHTATAMRHCFADEA